MVKKDGKFFHFHELVGKIGKITKIIVQAGFGQNNGYIVDDVASADPYRGCSEPGYACP